jgi:hypothetical protein
MHTSSVASEVALGTLLRLLSTKRKNVSAVAAPVGAHVGKVDEAVGNAMVELGLVWIRLRIGLRDALGDHLGIALFVAGVLAV